MQNLGVMTGMTASYPSGIIADGLVVVGLNSTTASQTLWPYAGDRAFRWTEAGGAQSLGVLPGDDRSNAGGTDERGRIVVGLSGNGSSTRAFVWTQATGMMELEGYLAAHGSSLAGWTLSSALSVSRDGSTIIGAGTLNGVPRPWIVRGLRLICRADFDDSGGLATQDVLEFLNAWFVADPRADFDGVNGLQVSDIFAFLNAWFAGC
jgi:hypothetical protein